jgi:hypothetical protein
MPKHDIDWQPLAWLEGWEDPDFTAQSETSVRDCIFFAENKIAQTDRDRPRYPTSIIAFELARDRLISSYTSHIAMLEVLGHHELLGDYYEPTPDHMRESADGDAWTVLMPRRLAPGLFTVTYDKNAKTGIDSITLRLDVGLR